MDTRTALGAAGGIALTVAGGVSALLLTMGPSGAAPAELETEGGAVVTQFVDEAGNPVDAPSGADAPMPEVVVIGPDGQPVDGSLQADPVANDELVAAYDAEEYPEGEEYPEEEEDHAEEAEEYPEGEEYPEEDESEDYEDDEDEEDEEDD